MGHFMPEVATPLPPPVPAELPAETHYTVQPEIAAVTCGAWDWVLCGTIITGLAILTYTGVRAALFQPIVTEIQGHRWLKLGARPAMLWGVMGTVLLILRTILWFRYKSFPAATMEDAPSLTIIIPAYNEGAMVLESIESVARAMYPRDRLEVIVVDDGSSDDTWMHIQRAAAKYPELIHPIRFPANRGKRAALAVGFEKARGEIVVTLDSDSTIDANSLLELAGPFRNSRVGAVAGKVKVYNRREGLIPRMLHVRFIVAFDLLRAAESTYGTVYCCPGALTAYRIAAVRKVLKKWQHQTFLGAPCTIGEDRALTNLMLESGYDTVYQRMAVVHTLAPTSYMKLCKMFLRWNRSYVREELYFMRIVWRRPLGPRIMAIFDRMITNLRFPVYYATLALLVMLSPEHPWMIVRLLLVMGIISAFCMLYYLRSERSPEFVYGIMFSYYDLFAMFWVFPVAVLTARSRGWLTR